MTKDPLVKIQESITLLRGVADVLEEALQELLNKSLFIPRSSKSENITRHITLDEVVKITGCSKASIHRWINKGIFPSQISLGQRRVAWKLKDIEDWMLNREYKK